jgi:hypothetical protein
MLYAMGINSNVSPTIPSMASIDVIGVKMDQHIHPWIELDVDLRYRLLALALAQPERNP